MPKRSRQLITAEITVASYFQSSVECNRSGEMKAPESKYQTDFQTLIDQETDLKNKEIIEFYQSVIKLDQNKYLKKSSEMTEEDVQILLSEQHDVMEKLKIIRSDTETWNFLAEGNNISANIVLFHLIINHYIMKKDEETAWLLDNFLVTCKEINLTHLLSYLKSQLDTKAELPHNVLIETQLIIDSHETPKNKIKQIEYAITTTQEIEKKNLPPQTHQLLDILFCHSLIMQTPQSATGIYLFGNIISQFIESGFLSDSLKSPHVRHSDRLFFQTYTLIKIIKSCLFHWSFSQTQNILEDLLASLTEKYIILVNSVAEYQSLPENILKDLQARSTEFIQKKLYYHLKESPQIFWQAVIKIISTIEGDIEKNIDYYLYKNLIHNEDICHLELFIEAYLDYPDQHNKIGYIAFLNALKFINAVKSIQINDPDGEMKVKTILEHFARGEYKFAALNIFMKSTKFPFFKQILKLNLLDTIKKINTYINSNESISQSNYFLYFRELIETILNCFILERNEMNRTINAFISKNISIALSNSEDKRSEDNLSITFVPCAELLSIIQLYSDVIETIEDKIDKRDLTPIDFVLPSLQFLNNDEIDIENITLIQLFFLILKVLKLSSQSKRLRDIDSFDPAAKIANCILKANSILNSIVQKYPDAWAFLLSNDGGRDILYHLITIDTNHTLAEETLSSVWRPAFLNDKTRPDELDLLQYLDIDAKISMMGVNSVLSLSESYPNSVILKAYDIFNDDYDVDIKIQKILDLAKTSPLNISEKISRRMNRLLMDSFSYLFLYDIDSYKDNLKKFLLAVKLLAEAKYIPSFLAQYQSNKLSIEEQVFLTIYEYYRYSSTLERHYSLSSQFTINIQFAQKTMMLIKCIKIFPILSQSKTFNPPHDILLTIASKIDRHIITNLSSEENESEESRQLKTDILEGIISINIAARPNIAKKVFHQYIDKLFLIDPVNMGLLTPLVIQRYHEDTQYQKKLKSLLGIIMFIDKLPELSMIDCKGIFEKKLLQLNFDEVLNDIEIEKYNFDILTTNFLPHFKNIMRSIRNTLERSLEPLFSVITSYSISETYASALIKFREIIIKLATLTGINITLVKQSIPVEYHPFKKLDLPIKLSESHMKFIGELNRYILRVIQLLLLQSESPSTDIQYTPFKYKNNLPREIQSIIDFFHTNMRLITTALDLKQGKRVEHEFSTLLTETYEKVKNLSKDNPYYWDLMIGESSAGRSILYLLLINLYVDAQLQIELFNIILTTLLKCATSEEEIDVLEFIDFTYRLEHRLISEDHPRSTAHHNRLLSIYLVLNCNENSSLEHRVGKIKKIAETPFEFTSNIPMFVSKMVQFLNIQRCLSQKEAINDVIPTCSDSQFFPTFPTEILNSQASSTLSLLYSQHQLIQSYLDVFIFKSHSLLHKKQVEIQYQFISYFKDYSHYHTINDDMILQVSHVICQRISQNIVFMESIEFNLDFCVSYTRMLTSLSSITLFANESLKAISTIFLAGYTLGAELFLNIFITHINNSPTHLPELKPFLNDLKKYHALLSAFKFFLDLGSLVKSLTTREQSSTTTHSSQEIDKVLNSIQDTEYLFENLSLMFLNSKFKNLSSRFKLELIELIKILAPKLSTTLSHSNPVLKKLQFHIIQLARLLGASEKEMSEINRHLFIQQETISLDDPLFDSETPSKPTKSNKSSKKNKSHQLVSTHAPSKDDPIDTEINDSNEDDNDLLDQEIKPTPTPTPHRKVAPLNSTTQITHKLKPESKIDTMNYNPSHRPINKNKTKSISEPVSVPTPLTLANCARVKFAPPQVHKLTNSNKASSQPAPLVCHTNTTQLSNDNPNHRASNSNTAPETTLNILYNLNDTKQEIGLHSTQSQARDLYEEPKDELNISLTISRNALHPDFLQFTDFIHHMTYPHTGRYTYLMGGALIFACENKPNTGDYDLIAFCKNDYLLAILKKHYYHCKKVGIHEIIEVTIPIQECALIKINYPLKIEEIDILLESCGTTAAYVRTHDGLYYINKKTNICEKIPISNDSIDKFDRKFHSHSSKTILTSVDLNKIMLITSPYPVHCRAIEIDITCVDPTSHPTSLDEIGLLNEHLNTCDLTPSAGAIALIPGAEEYPIQGSFETINSLKNKVIAPVNSETLFFEDHTQLLRVAKMKLKHNNYNPNKTITDFIYLNNGSYVVALIHSFIFNVNNRAMNKTHFRRIGTQLDKFFSRFDTTQIIVTLLDIYFIEGLTQIKQHKLFLLAADALDTYLDTLPEHSLKMGFYYYLFAIANITKQAIKKDLYNLILETLPPPKGDLNPQESFKNHILFIERSMSYCMVSSTSIGKNDPQDAFKKFLNDIKLCYLDSIKDEAPIMALH